jgi:hypothetical protein
MKIIFFLFFLIVNISCFGQPQFASSVLSFSSQYGAVNYSAEKALGAPDVASCSDNSNAWASLTADGQREYLELGFATPQQVNSIKIYQTFNTGAIDTVYIRNAGNGNWVSVYSSTAALGPCTNVLSIAPALTSFNVDAIRIAVNSPAISTWNEIDAVSIQNRINTSLLINGSAEDDAPDIYGWTALTKGADCSGSGGWRIIGNQGGYPLAKDGAYIFFPGCYTNGIEVYELYQDINLTAFANDIDLGIQPFIFNGSVRSFEQAPRDSAQMIVEYRDASNIVLAAYNTGLNGNTADWDLKTDTRIAPVGSRTVRVRLLSHHFNANSVDSYFDDLSFNALPASSRSLCGPSANTLITSNITGDSYQWQLNTGNGFTNITNNSNYNGANTGALDITGAPSNWYGYQYRCIVNGNNSSTTTIKFIATWTGAGNDNLWENIANWNCTSLPDGYTDVIINNGTVTVNSNASCRSLITNKTVSLSVKTGAKLSITH